MTPNISLQSSQSLNKKTKAFQRDMIILDDASLLIKKMKSKHSGLYNCYLNASSLDYETSLTTSFATFSYFVQVVDEKNQTLLNGSYTEWNYYEDNVYATAQRQIQSILLNNRTTNTSTVKVHWTDWGNCLCGIYKYDTRSYKYGYCCANMSEHLVLPCHSLILKEFYPELTKIVEHISVFKQYKRCLDDCVPGKTFSCELYRIEIFYHILPRPHNLIY